MKVRQLLLFCLVVLAGTTRVSAQQICSNQTGTHNGFYYSWWKDNGGSACITLGAAGNYSTTWSGVNNFVGGKGWSSGTANRVVNFSGSFNGGSNGYLTLYGWTRNSLIEYYVVENYGSWTPPGATSAGTFTSDGGTYNLYRTQRVQQPSIDGTQTFYQYWSVRTSKRSSGTITFANHAAAWASKGWNLGSSWAYQIMATEGYQSSGSSNITVSEGTTTPPGGGGGTGSNTIVVRARGTSGAEQIQVRVDNTTIGTFTLSTSMANYTASTNSTGGITVQYTNDASGRDVQVDYITVNGTTRQAENQSTNTAVYQNGACGGSNSEMMHCNGYIGFGTVSGGGGGGGGGGTTCNGYYALTFDDGPGSNTNTLLGILSSAGVKATFFPMGNRISSNLSAFQAMVNAGHKIQNHSFTHSHMLNWSYQQVYNDIQQAQQAIQNAGGGTPTLFRPPYGEVNATIQSVCSALGLRIVTWSVDSQDWNGASTSSIVSAANNLQNGGIILMHDAYSSTNNAVSQIVNNLRGRNLCAGIINSGGGVGARMGNDDESASNYILDEPASETEAIQIYPNPVMGGKFTVEVPEGTSEVRIHDFSGKVLKAQAVETDQRSVDVEVNAVPGLYILKAINTRKSQYKKFFIR